MGRDNQLNVKINQEDDPNKLNIKPFCGIILSVVMFAF